MKRLLLVPSLLLAASALLTATLPGTASASPFHFGLRASTPAKGETVHELHEVRLRFTEEPQAGTTSIRLVDASGSAVKTSDVQQDAEDATEFYVTLAQTPAPGEYTVAWRGMGDDGHVVRGTFTFQVAAH